MVTTLDTSEKHQILTLRLLIARAAQKDSLSWWEDDSLTPSGKYLLDRLYFVNADQAGRKLALEAAKVRYQAAFGSENNAVHLFHLDQTGDVELSLSAVDLSTIPIPAEPIPTTDALHDLLLEIINSPVKYQIVGERSNNRLEIKLGETSSKPDLIQIVKALSLATIEGSPGKPLFPYIRPIT